MYTFEILCVTMNQDGFEKIRQMNIHSNVVFANQADSTSYTTIEFDNCTAKMVTTTTRGVGANRNLALMYASADICLFSDDDVTYYNTVEQQVLSEFEKYPDADVIIFHLEADDVKRKQTAYSRTRKHHKFENMPWGACRIAVRLNSVKKANLWFSTLFGGGCIFPSGEDSKWLLDAKHAGLTFYVSKETIGTVSFDVSTWFTGADEKYFYGKGAFYQAVHPKTKYLWMLYFAFRTGKTECNLLKKLSWMRNGFRGYELMLTFTEWKEQ